MRPLVAAVTLPALGAWVAAALVAAAGTGAVVEVFWVAAHRPLAGRVVAVDAGHGGFDGGVARGGLVEKELTLDLARRLAREIRARGGRPVLTRHKDVAHAEDDREDLRLRLKTAGDADVFLSIHANAFPDPGQFGAQTFYWETSEEGRRLALLIQGELVALDPENYREAIPADLYLLRESPVPAALVEVGFLSNARDRELLADHTHRDRLAAAVARALERYFAGEDPPQPVPGAAAARLPGASRRPPGFQF